MTPAATQLALCPNGGKLLLRLEDDGPAIGERAIFNVNIFNPCWLWEDAELSGVRAVKVRAGRIAPPHCQPVGSQAACCSAPAHCRHRPRRRPR